LSLLRFLPLFLGQSSCFQVIHHLFPGVDQSRLRHPAVRRAFLDTCSQFSALLPLPFQKLLRVTLVIRNRLQSVSFSAFSGLFGVRLMAAGAARLQRVCVHRSHFLFGFRV
jgi:hypothetical protein